MKIVIAPNALKGSLSAHVAANAMAQGVRRVLPSAEIILMPVADGGDGFAEVLVAATQGEKSNLSVAGPLGKPVSTPLYISKEKSLAIIEIATIAGLTLIPEQERNPMMTTTLGVGEAIRFALDAGVKRLVIGIGGSATNDAGIGMATALGMRFLDKAGQAVQPIGACLGDIVRIDPSDMDSRLKNINIEVACDVDNPFFGEQGAAYVFAPQKGASAEQVRQLDEGLRHIAHLIKTTLNIDISQLPGAGAAGGLGGGLHAFCNATLSRGVDIVLDTVKIDAELKDAALVLTAEGQLDQQTWHGKAPAGIAKRARQHNIPCIVLAGSVDSDVISLQQSNFTAAFSICPGPIPIALAMERAFDYLRDTTEQVVRSFAAAVNIAPKLAEP